MKFLRLGKFYININNIESINYSMLYEKHIIYFNTASCTYIVKIELNDLFIYNIKHRLYLRDENKIPELYIINDNYRNEVEKYFKSNNLKLDDIIKAAYSEIIENINKIIEKGMYVNLNEKYNFNVIKIKEIKDK